MLTCEETNHSRQTSLHTHNWLILVGGFNPSEKNISQLELLFPIYGKIKVMFQSTNQILCYPMTIWLVV
jgi:hypothetical protein